jgi:hypothetical protein
MSLISAFSLLSLTTRSWAGILRPRLANPESSHAMLARRRQKHFHRSGAASGCVPTASLRRIAAGPRIQESMTIVGPISPAVGEYKTQTWSYWANAKMLTTRPGPGRLVCRHSALAACSPQLPAPAVAASAALMHARSELGISECRAIRAVRLRIADLRRALS